mgnify:CR=1 FL=1
MRVVSILIFTFALLLSAGCRPAAEPVSISKRPISNNRMPRTNLPMPPTKPVEELGWKLIDSDKEEKLGDLRGKVLVLDFWATYCPPCIEEIPHLNELQAKYGEKGFQVIGLHVGGEEDRPRVPAFMERLKIDYPLAYPEDELVYSLLGDDTRIPQTLVFDREGKLVKQFVSYDEEIKKRLDKTIEEQFDN